MQLAICVRIPINLEVTHGHVQLMTDNLPQHQIALAAQEGSASPTARKGSMVASAVETQWTSVQLTFCSALSKKAGELKMVSIATDLVRARMV